MNAVSNAVNSVSVQNAVYEYSVSDAVRAVYQVLCCASDCVEQFTV